MRRSGPPLFEGRLNYPGREGGAFAAFVTFGEKFERQPGWLFALGVLAVWGLVALAFDHSLLFMAIFSIVDWATLVVLKEAKRSFGPPKFPSLLLLLLRLPWALLPSPFSWAAQGTGSLLVVYGFAIEPFWLQVTYHSGKSAKLAGLTRLRLLHLGDLHMERMTAREVQLLAMVKEIAPDLIVFTGDIMSYSCTDDEEAWEHARQVLSKFHAPLGTYLVAGSPPVDREDVLKRVLAGLSITWLRDSVQTVSCDGVQIEIAGLSCSHRPAIDGKKLESLISSKNEQYRILLYHSPDLAPLAERNGIDLQLSGHTHGGQVRLPFLGALYASSLYGKRFEMGETRLGEMTLYVTRGLGMEGRGAPRVRFLCRPEMAVWDLGPA